MSHSVTPAGRSAKVKLMVLTGLFAALVYVFTAFLHIPTGAGYTHAGDGLIYLAACILPAPYAAAAGAVGGALSDGLTGFAVWMPATIVIKVLTSFCFSRNTKKIICVRNLLGIVPALVLCVVGYSLYEGVFMAGGINTGAVIAAFGQTPAYCVQVAASSLLFVAVGSAFDRSGIRKLIK